MSLPHHRTLLIATMFACAASTAVAQKSTEIYIPIGQSPGLSGRHTLIGQIESINATEKSMTVRDVGGSMTTVKPGEYTRIWIDRHKLGEKNRQGDYTDYRKDQRVEIKYRNNNRQAGEVEWVKVQVDR